MTVGGMGFIPERLLMMMMMMMITIMLVPVLLEARQQRWLVDGRQEQLGQLWSGTQARL